MRKRPLAVVIILTLCISGCMQSNQSVSQPLSALASESSVSVPSDTSSVSESKSQSSTDSSSSQDEISTLEEQAVDVKPEDRILMVNDKLYYGTNETGPMGFSDATEGEILSTVNANETPKENGQSNFGEVGASYTDDPGLGFIMVLINDEWYVFYVEK